MVELNVTTITHYMAEDTDFSGDYTSKEVVVHGHGMISFNDSYHDNKTPDKSFIAGLKFMAKLVGITVVEDKPQEIADCPF